MRRIAARYLRPGMELAKTIYDTDGRVLLARGMILKESFINRLNLLGVGSVYIVDARLKDVEVADVLSDETRQQARSVMRKVYHDVEKSSELDMKSVAEAVNNILSDILNSDTLLTNLLDIRFIDDYTFSHSVNVCVLSTITAMGMNRPRHELLDIGIGAMLHDIGKMFVPEQILCKPGPLNDSEYEEIKRHSENGFEALRKKSNISLTSAHVAFQHHERFDGTGYPRGIAGEDIHPYARVVAVTDVYDALTSNRVYRDAYLPHQAAEYVLSGSGTHFFQGMVQSFIKFIPLYPLGTIVELSDGKIGAVVDVNLGLVGRPIIRVLYDNNGEKVREPYEVDLSKYLSLLVENVIADDRFFAN